MNTESFEQLTDSSILRNVWVSVESAWRYRPVDPGGTVIVHERVDGLEGSTIQIELVVRACGGVPRDAL